MKQQDRNKFASEGWNSENAASEKREGKIQILREEYDIASFVAGAETDRGKGERKCVWINILQIRGLEPERK